jgi:hypothetical protein
MDDQPQFTVSMPEASMPQIETTPINSIPEEPPHQDQAVLKHSDNIARVASLVFVLIFLFVALIIAITRVDSFLRLKALDDCARASRFEQRIDKQNAVASYPITDLYKSCIREKGY